MSKLHKLLSSSTQAARETFFRFPVALIAAWIGTGIALYLANDFIDFEEIQGLLKMLLMCVYVMLGAVALKLFGESRKLQSHTIWILMALLIADAIGYYFFLPETLETGPAFHIVRWFVTCLFVATLIPLAGYLRKDSKTLSFWDFTRTILERFVVTFVFGFLIFGGLSLAILSIDVLFDINVDDEWFARIWILAVGLFGPWFFLAGYPKQLDISTKPSYHKLLKILGVYIGAPIVATYLIILYAYSIKILTTWEWPKGQVVWLMLIFLLIGFAIAMIIYPLKDIEKAGKKYARILMGFFIATLPLMVVYFLAIRFRLLDYGITENRYLIVVFGIWIIFCSLYYVLSKTKNIRWFFGSFIILGVISTWLPGINMFHVSMNSQVERLEEIFISHNMIEGGKIVPAEKRVEEDGDDLRSIFHYLRDRDKMHIVLDRLDDAVDFTLSGSEVAKGNKMPAFEWGDTRNLLEALNVSADYYGYWDERESFNYASGEEGMLISGFDYVIPMATYGGFAATGKYSVTTTNSNDSIEISKSEEVLVSIDVNSVIESFEQDSSALFYEGEAEGIRYKVMFTELSGYKMDNNVESIYMRGFVLIGE